MRALIVSLWALAAAGSSLPVQAGLPNPPVFSSEWSIQPAHPTTRDHLAVRNVLTGCNGAAGARTIDINYATRLITFYVEGGSDICMRHVYGDVQDSRLGYLPAGAYTVRFYSCEIPYEEGVGSCGQSSRPNLSFVVTEAGRPRQVIPAWSLAGAFGTVFLLSAIALLRLKSRQG